MEGARELWKRIETLHAVTYFAPESVSAAKAAGLRGFWMGYFGFRASPLGKVEAAVVEATFANFAPDMVRRSIPDAWNFAEPADLVISRSDAAAEALRQLAPEIELLVERTNEQLGCIVDAAASIGRPLFSANRDVTRLDDPVAQLWQHCTTLREHRGDGHVMALAAAGVDGCQAHQILIASHGLPVDVFRDNRGWTEQEWNAAARGLQQRGLIHDSMLTTNGRRVHDEIERLTDVLANEPVVASLSDTEFVGLLEDLTPSAIKVAACGVIPFPNPMGLPAIVAP